VGYRSVTAAVPTEGQRFGRNHRLGRTVPISSSWMPPFCGVSSKITLSFEYALGVKMGNLFSYLDETKWNNLFEVSEGSHIIPHTYNVIKAAVRNRADKLILTSTEFIWSRQGTILGRFPTTYPVAP